MINVSVEIKRDLPIDQLKKWQDKVIYSMARATLDFTNSANHFPYRTGELNRASMAQGVEGNNGTYFLGARGVNYAPRVWEYGPNTNWTNSKTLPQWYTSVFSKYKNEIVNLAIKNSESELK